MLSFLRSTLSTVIGVLIAAVILFFVATAGIIGWLSALEGDTVTEVTKDSVLVIDLSGELVDYDAQDPIDAALVELFDSGAATLALCDLLEAIHAAAVHDKIRGICLLAGELSASPAALQELRAALLQFRKSGKFIVSYADDYTQGAYYLCSVADHLLLNPQGSVDWMGMAAEVTHYKELLDKIGVGVQVFKVGNYKSAVEPFVQSEMSNANREQITAYLSSIWGEIVSAVSESRNIPVDTLNRYADEVLSFQTGEAFQQKGMVDTLLLKRDVNAFINAELLNAKPSQKLNQLSYGDLLNLSADDDLRSATIAVYYAEGEILSGSEDTFSAGIYCNETCKALRDLAEDDEVAAVVLRVNSPGGSAFASEQIWNEVERLKEKKPVVVSMGGVAASGGYYIACGADKIVAEPTTLTGSIGIFGLIPNLRGLYDKIGLHSDVVATHRHSDMLFLNAPLDSDEQQLVQRNVEQGYDLFLRRCAAGRGMTTDSLLAIAEGRVWTGEMALKVGLVDTLGGIETAIALAAVAAEVDAYHVENYPLVESDIIKILFGGKEQLTESRAAQLLGERYSIVRFIRDIERQDRVQARLPYVLNLNL